MSATIETDAWPETKVARLKDLWKAGVKKPQIALELEVSENAITGKVYRLGLSRDRKKESPTIVLSKRHKSMVKRPVPAPNPKPFAGPRLEPMSKRHIPEIASPNARVWSTRTSRECAFPLGEPVRPSEQICCCNPTLPGTHYCDDHNRLMFQERRR